MSELRIGDLTADLDGFDLRAICWRGVEVVNRLYAAVRDDAWGTPAPAGAEPSMEIADDAVTVRFSVTHADAGMPFEWTGTYTLTSDAVSATFDGAAIAPLATNRAGFCLLHPLSQVGGTLTHSRDGVADQLVLPTLLMPQPLFDNGRTGAAFGPFDTLSIEANGARVDAAFTGDLFETEDQRNWTDASFKTYCTPLSKPIPRRLAPGDEVHQRIELRFSPSDLPLAAAPVAPSPRGTVFSATVTSALSPDDAAAALAVVDRLRADVTLDASARPVIEAVRAAADSVRPKAHHGDTNTGQNRPVGWELAVRADAGADWAFLRTLIADAVPPEVLLVLPADDDVETTPPSVVAAARAALGDTVAVIGGGTRRNFTELLRHRVDGMAAVSCTWSPLVHADDDRSIRETTASYPAIVATARHVAPDATFAVGPLRDVERLSPDWVAESVEAWAAAGADLVCVAPAETLVRDGSPTAVGHAVAAAVHR